MIDYYAVTKKLIGRIDPVGDSGMDEVRFKNLENMAELVNKLLTDMDYIVVENKNSREYSVVKARKFVEDYFNKLGIKE